MILVSALYGLGQLLSSVSCIMNIINCYSNQVVQKGFLELTKWCTRQTKWYAPLHKGLARTLARVQPTSCVSNECPRARAVLSRPDFQSHVCPTTQNHNARGKEATCVDVSYVALQVSLYRTRGQRSINGRSVLC